MAFLLIGGVGLAVLLVILVVGDFFDIDGPLDGDLFSLASIAAFAGAFGFAAAGVESASSSLPLAIAVGVGAGAVFSAFTIWLTRTLRSRTTDATVNSRSLVGHEARVLTAIPADGHGEVTLRIGGQRVKYAARASGPLEAGTRVWVSGVLSATALEVTPVDALEANPHHRPD